MFEEFAQLVTFCRDDSDVKRPLQNMRPHIAHFAKESIKIVQERKAEIKTIVPFLGRGLLEGCLTALLFRIDPFRALTLMRFQSHQEFDHNRPNQISIDWSADLLSEKVDERDIWLPKQKAISISRALLSPYCDEVIWRPAFIRARDTVPTSSLTQSFPTLLSEDPEIFIRTIRGSAAQLYSFWSKGLHCEFFSIGENILDDVTCVEKIKRTADIVLELAFVSQFAQFSVGNWSPSQAISCYLNTKAALHA
ncbi:hypothetical protein KQX64_04630 [Rhodopseudomonas palustris]|nr:hypothetical protein KQX64_04630 [Rhodopseudomonas palustris]